MPDPGLDPEIAQLRSNVLRAARWLYKTRRSMHTALYDVDKAMRELDDASRTLDDAEARARVQANPLARMGG